jgi:hypothetical protein
LGTFNVEVHGVMACIRLGKRRLLNSEGKKLTAAATLKNLLQKVTQDEPEQ